MFRRQTFFVFVKRRSFDPSLDQATGLPTVAMIAAHVYVGTERAGVVSAINPKGGGLFEAQALGTLEWKAFLIGLVLGQGHE